VLIGSAVTFAVGWLVSLAAGPAEASHE